MVDLKTSAQPLRVMELFAGVGGFRLGLNQACSPDGTSGFVVSWANQFEPGNKKQWAAQLYRARWGEDDLVNQDIFEVLDNAQAMAHLDVIAPDVLVGGFPCQDYSVAKPLSHSKGLEGKKGVLWWAIHRMLEARLQAGAPVKYLMLENVDRLLVSPSDCRGRDFAVMLASLQSLGYAVEWRIINSADYCFPQKRKRIYIVGYHRSTPTYANLQQSVKIGHADIWLTENGTMARALFVRLAAPAKLKAFDLPADIFEAQSRYRPKKGRSCFGLGGLCIDGQVWTSADLVADTSLDFCSFAGQVKAMTLGEVIGVTSSVPEKFFIDEACIDRWSYLKGSKSLTRTSASGHDYTYTEGMMAFPDLPTRPARTIITSEGNASPSRTTHVVCHSDGRLRRLVPEELEALNGFPRGFTDIPGIGDNKRAFLMGNALVVGIVQALGTALLETHHITLQASAL